MAEQVGVMSKCIKSLDGLAYTNQGRNLKIFSNFEDFLGSNAALLGIYVTASGGVGASVTGDIGTQLRQGLLQLQSGTTALGWAYLAGGSNNLSGIRFGAGSFTIEADIYIYNLSTAIEEFTLQFGFGDGLNTENNDGAYFYYDRALAGVNWRLKTSAGGVRTDTNSLVAVAATAWTRLKVVVNATGTIVSYYINDVLVGTNTLNIPTAAGTELGITSHIVKSVGITARAFTIDWVWLHNDFTVSR